jgi:ribosome-binding protein aMBF1 (putative translation factor)
MNSTLGKAAMRSADHALSSVQSSPGARSPHPRSDMAPRVSADGRLRLGQWLAELRQARGLSQGEVAARIGWDTPSTVSRLENGLRQKVTRRDLLAYLGAIGSEDAQLRGELIGMWREIKR